MLGIAPFTAQRLVVIGVIAVLVLAGSFGAWFFAVTTILYPAHPIPREDGPTFYEALAAVNSTVENTSGGPWSLFSVYGVAAQVPFSMNVWGSPSGNVSQNACMAQFDGLTTWNGTPPLFNGDFDSGTAPFWQLGYYSEATQEILVGTDVLGQAHIYPPMSISSTCGTTAWYDFPSSPDYWASQLTPLPMNTPLAATLAWPTMEPNWLEQEQPLVEVYFTGPGMLVRSGDVSQGAWGVIVQRCGLAGITGWEPLIERGVSREDQVFGAGVNESTNCSLTYSAPGLSCCDSYLLTFSLANQSTSGRTSQFSSTFKIAIANANGSAMENCTGCGAWGLANWMTSFNLTNSAGAQLPLAAPGCPRWVPSISDCSDNASGWYAVLLSPAGQWLASYGTTSVGSGWTVPVTAMIDYQQLVIVTPSSWHVSGDTLNVTTTTTYSMVRGQLSL